MGDTAKKPETVEMKLEPLESARSTIEECTQVLLNEPGSGKAEAARFRLHPLLKKYREQGGDVSPYQQTIRKWDLKYGE